MRVFVLITLILIIKLNVAKTASNFFQCSCTNHERIIGGNDVKTNKYPYQVSLFYLNSAYLTFFKLSSFFTTMGYKKDRFFCSGIIVNENYVLTAAHCLKDFSDKNIFSNIVVLAGDNNLIKHFNFIKRYIVEYKIHPKFNYLNFKNDIALLKIDPPFVFNEVIKPACLLGAIDSFFDQNLTLSGWGSTTDPAVNGENISENLKEIKLSQIDDSMCLERENPSKLICVENVVPDENACTGDSGGPLNFLHNNKIYVIGIFSRIKSIKTKCDGYLSFTKIKVFFNWILKETKNYICVPNH